ncbi:3-oxoacyl-ACP reductase [Catellicoccus marimammalium]|uniref:3-oxoacyl-[acyl-carrier protein] reductase n=1 Tax=Catellicoccus marimammalium M35/04/3 TaxID=1234409 RepID=K8ZQ50_9ENTE|nr:3-oxoacyl-ACP reductase [Catellicoccus marimammalium]EKU27706.1 3-oxoacyl-[acyl-carrier protein] reductase [Catellicoccus marimammalium M35/04/3]
MTNPSFYNQSVVITGCSSGIGKAQAEAFLDKGAMVYGLDCQPCPLEHPNFFFSLCDITKEKEVEKVLQKIERVDILCNTAGILDDFAPSLDTSVELFDRIFAVNVRGTFLLCNACLPKMLAQGKGCIINMASIASLIPGGGGAAYTASKHAIYGYTKQLTYDYARKGIRANAIAPGAIRTPMNQKDFLNGGEIAKEIAKETPCGRYAEPEEIAQVTLFLASDDARYIYGDIIPVDGGWMNRS